MISFRQFIPAALALCVSAVPFAANALSVTIEDTGTGDSVTLLDLDNDDIIAGVNVSVGGTSDVLVSLTTSFSSDADQTSILTLSVTNVTGGTGSIKITANDDGYVEGGDAPQFSNVHFLLNASDLSDDLTGSAYAGGNLVATGMISDPLNDIEGSASLALVDPFSMTIVAEVMAPPTGFVNFDATLTATVPVPAAGLLLLAGLGGLGVASRRRKGA